VPPRHRSVTCRARGAVTGAPGGSSNVRDRQPNDRGYRPDREGAPGGRVTEKAVTCGWVTGVRRRTVSPHQFDTGSVSLCSQQQSLLSRDCPPMDRQIYIAFYVADITSCTRYLYGEYGCALSASIINVFTTLGYSTTHYMHSIFVYGHTYGLLAAYSPAKECLH
jgi:hypothetical protein